MLVRNKTKPEHGEGRTAAYLRREAVARGLRVGRKMRVEKPVLTSGGTVRQIAKKGKVSALYPYIFACEINGHTECFRYNQLVGNEAERVKLGG